MDKIVVTGGAGAIGSVLVRQIANAGWRPVVLDIAATSASADHGDICNVRDVEAALRDAVGVFHLAAVSRVGWGEDDPQRCRAVNVDGTRNVARAAMSASQRPWMVFTSSREVYGDASRLPVVEGDPIAPVNTYGRSKAEGERIVAEARTDGLACASIRLPSVYGSVNDIPDRVIPALVRRAVEGQRLHLTGASQLCDFLHVHDAVDGLIRAAKQLARGVRDLPTMHLASGRGTSLGALAALITDLADSSSEVVEDPPRPFDVRGFVGDATRAGAVLEWKATIPLEQGLRDLIASTRALHASKPAEER